MMLQLVDDEERAVADLERLKARFSTRGITLSEMPHGEYVVHQGSWCRVLDSTEAARKFARVIGV